MRIRRKTKRSVTWLGISTNPTCDTWLILLSKMHRRGCLHWCRSFYTRLGHCGPSEAILILLETSKTFERRLKLGVCMGRLPWMCTGCAHRASSMCGRTCSVATLGGRVHAACLGLVVQPLEHVRACMGARWGACVGVGLGLCCTLEAWALAYDLDSLSRRVADTWAMFGGFVAPHP